MPQDSRAQANRRRKAAEKLAKWKVAAAESPAAKPARKKAASKD